MPDQHTDLTTPENVATGQEIYDQITHGQIDDVHTALNQAYGRED